MNAVLPEVTYYHETLILLFCYLTLTCTETRKWTEQGQRAAEEMEMLSASILMLVLKNTIHGATSSVHNCELCKYGLTVFRELKRQMNTYKGKKKIKT